MTASVGRKAKNEYTVGIKRDPVNRETSPESIEKIAAIIDNAGITQQLKRQKSQYSRLRARPLKLNAFLKTRDTA